MAGHYEYGSEPWRIYSDIKNRKYLPTEDNTGCSSIWTTCYNVIKYSDPVLDLVLQYFLIEIQWSGSLFFLHIPFNLVTKCLCCLNKLFDFINGVENLPLTIIVL